MAARLLLHLPVCCQSLPYKFAGIFRPATSSLLHRVGEPFCPQRRCSAPIAIGKGTASFSTSTLKPSSSSLSSCVWMNGRLLGDLILKNLFAAVSMLRQDFGLIPSLVCLLVGDRPDSIRYLASKERLAHRLGIRLLIERFPSTVTESALLSAIRRHNADPFTHGILVQLPLPERIRREKVLEEIAVEKDVDGLHPVNLGRLSRSSKNRFGKEEFDELTSPAPCTPKGILMLLDYYNIPCHRRSVVVLGRSSIVGLPVSLMLSNRDATVSICHSHTPQSVTQRLCHDADIIVAACGVPALVQADWVRPGATVIDVGINPIGAEHSLYTASSAQPSVASEYFPVTSPVSDGLRVIGDVHPDVAKVARFLSPVPGGVGPMTLSVLMANIVQCAVLQQERSSAEWKEKMKSSVVLRACATGDILRHSSPGSGADIVARNHGGSSESGA